MKKHKKSGYSKQERMIFEFWDGEKRRKVDPLVVQRALVSDKDFDLEIELKHIAASTPLAVEAMENIIRGIRAAFKIKSLDDGGLTDSECLAVMVQFGTWMGDVKKKLLPFQTSVKLTDFPGFPTTPSTVALSSTETVSSADDQVQLSLASE
jgi:hypothetical protein